MLKTRQTFRPDDAGATQRRIHWLNAAASFLVFVLTGTPGLLAFFFGILLLHVVAGPSTWAELHGPPSRRT